MMSNAIYSRLPAEFFCFAVALCVPILQKMN